MSTEQVRVRDPSVARGQTDEEVVRRVLAGEPAWFEVLMRRHNQPVYRAVRSILRSEPDAEEAMQLAWLNAWRHLPGFKGDSAFKTWLMRIAVNEALMRRRKDARLKLVPDPVEPKWERSDPTATPEDDARRGELRVLLEDAVDGLADGYRSVFVLREVEGLSTQETAEALNLSEDVVKTRLHRARAALREALMEKVAGGAEEAFTFLGPRCDRMVERVMAQVLAWPER